MGLSKDYFVFDGVDSRDFDVYLFRKEILNWPKRSVKKVSVPGRNGDIILDNGRYDNVAFSYGAVIIRRVAYNLAGFRDLLTSAAGRYSRLEDTFERDEYYLARLSGGVEPVTTRNMDAARMELVFERKPQRYLKDGSVPVTVTGSTFMNPSHQISKPIVKITRGSGLNDSFGLNGITVTVTWGDTPQTVTAAYVDCDSGDVRGNGGEDLNGIVSISKAVGLSTVRWYDFPVLAPGENSVSMNGASIDITPRWWRL